MMRVLIADDHAILRQGLRQILAEEFNGIEFGEAGTTAETLQQLRRQRWDVLILDINMPGRSGLEVLNDTHMNYPKLPVLVLSSTPEEQLAVRTLKAGARGYLNKQSAAEELVNAVKKITTGGRYISTTLAERLADELDRDTERQPHERLSDREYQVFRMLAAGKTATEIAAELALSVKTISTFRRRVLEKLDVSNNVELSHYAHKHGLMNSLPPDRTGNRAP